MLSSAARNSFQWDEVGGITVVHFTIRSIRADEDIVYIFEELNRLVEEGHTRLVLDFSSVQHFASLTIGKLMALHRKLQSVKGRLALCQLTSVVTEILAIMRLERHFHIYKTEEEALQSF